MQFVQMDLRAMEFPEGAYNVVVDKGTLDSVLCGEGSTLNVQKMLMEVSRVLDSKGELLLFLVYLWVRVWPLA